jgi:hypothetical protein
MAECTNIIYEKHKIGDEGSFFKGNCGLWFIVKEIFIIAGI